MTKSLLEQIIEKRKEIHGEPDLLKVLESMKELDLPDTSRAPMLLSPEVYKTYESIADEQIKKKIEVQRKESLNKELYLREASGLHDYYLQEMAKGIAKKMEKDKDFEKRVMAELEKSFEGED